MNKYRKIAAAAAGAGVISLIAIAPAFAEGSRSTHIGGWGTGKESSHWEDKNLDSTSTSVKFSGCNTGSTPNRFSYASLQLKKARAALPDPVVNRDNNYCDTSSFGDKAAGTYYFNYAGLNGTDQPGYKLNVSSVTIKY
ncbi:hypothetical protein OG217_19585 [Streptomyces sp. NBC_01023]|uniref:hypothetical protein n=1 Tax=unclassified Streptomyces TaxID=2593676 RepID=UPI002E22624A|nr:hypothetical protein OG217_19585 [Streptomyces sp. NBC_01023]